ncbi:hypothetical protein KM043_015258 [Ampulex compressa]|nr:hypothetical protein KM043_015258 [Ampulex compressa]
MERGKGRIRMLREERKSMGERERIISLMAEGVNKESRRVQGCRLTSLDEERRKSMEEKESINVLVAEGLDEEGRRFRSQDEIRGMRGIDECTGGKIGGLRKKNAARR